MELENEELIKKWEGLRLIAYKPTPSDRWTIGWGHTKNVTPGQRITRNEAQALFEEDVAWAEEAVNKHVKVKLSQKMFDTLVSFTFNVGEGNFSKSTLLRKLNSGDYEGAANEFGRWKYQGKTVLKGLVRRRAEEEEYFREGIEDLNDQHEEPKKSWFDWWF